MSQVQQVMDNTKDAIIGGKRFINLCPHDIILTDGQTLRIVFKASGRLARIEAMVRREHMEMEVAPSVVLNLPIQRISDDVVQGLPGPVEGTYYITSYAVAKHVQREDVLSPLTDASAIRDESNKVIGVRGFQNFT